MEYVKLSNKLSDLRKKYKTKFLIGESEGLDSLKNEIYTLDAKIKKIDSALGTWSSPNGNYKGSL